MFFNDASFIFIHISFYLHPCFIIPRDIYKNANLFKYKSCPCSKMTQFLKRWLSCSCNPFKSGVSQGFQTINPTYLIVLIRK